MTSRLLVTLSTFALVFAASGPAHAAIVPGKALDGPSADIPRAWGIDVAPDGSGGAVWIKKDGGKDHVFVSRIAAGAFGPAERVDPAALVNDSSRPAIAAANGGRLAVTYLNGALGKNVHAALSPPAPASRSPTSSSTATPRASTPPSTWRRRATGT